MDNFNHKQIESLEKIANQLGAINNNFAKMLKEMEQIRLTLAKENCICKSIITLPTPIEGSGDVRHSEK